MMVIEKLLQPCKMFTVQKILQKSTNALVTTRKELGHVFERKKDVKRLGWEGTLTNAKTDTLQNCFGIALRQNAGDIEKMISGCKASMFHVAGYHGNCMKNY